MAPDLVSQWHNSCEIADCPAPWRETSTVDHATCDGQEEKVHPLEVAHDAVKAHTKAGLCQFLGCGGPFNLHAEEMTENGFEEVEGDAAKKEQEEAMDCYSM